MGQSESHGVVDDTVPPVALSSRTIEGVAKYIKDGKARRIVTMVGAGISTSAGIPDFRSPDTGLYANLARLNLPYAEAVFDISYFRQNPLPFYTLAHELYPGSYRPTITHSFIALLEKKGLLLKNFTQNIDCLEREAGVSGDKIVEAHGSFASQKCIDCHRPYPAEDMKEMIRTKDVPHCQDEACGGLVKPDIVFFGEQLPSAFFENRTKPAEADLAIVMGTSLAVQPFASLPRFVRDGVPRVLINFEIVGTMGSRADDVLLLGDCDSGVRKLAKACGWLEELEELWSKTNKIIPAARRKDDGVESQQTQEESLAGEIERLTKDIDETLQLSKSHAERTNKEISTTEQRKGLPQETSEDEARANQTPELAEKASHEKSTSASVTTQSKEEKSSISTGSDMNKNSSL